VFIPGRTVHSLGGDVLVFEVQQNSDVTYRVGLWDAAFTLVTGC